MALFSSAADTFVFSFLIRRFLFREGRSTTEMLPAQEAWRTSGEALFTGVRGRGILRTSPFGDSRKSVCGIPHIHALRGPETSTYLVRRRGWRSWPHVRCRIRRGGAWRGRRLASRVGPRVPSAPPTPPAGRAR